MLTPYIDRSQYSCSFRQKDEHEQAVNFKLSCGYNEKSNSCDNLEGMGTAWVSTNDSYYADYFPNGWMRNDGWYNASGNTVNYDAVPTYYGLRLTQCTSNASKCKDHGSVYWTGIKTTHPDGNYMKYSTKSISPDVNMNGYSYSSGGECPRSDTRNTGKTPCAQRRCNLCIAGICQKGWGRWNCDGGYQYLCAKSLKRDGVCERIGTTGSYDAVAALYDALGEGSGAGRKTTETQQPGFGDIDTYLGYAQCKYPTNTLSTPQDVIDFILSSKLVKFLET